MHAPRESDEGVVPMKQANKPMEVGAEPVEGRPETEGNPDQPTAPGTPSPDHATSGLGRVREAARRDKDLRFTNLLHHITPGMLTDAYWALKRQAAPGVDGVTWHEYGDALENRIVDLHARVHSGRYRAQPSKRAWIPKPDGRRRPLGIAAMEDKVLQLATTWVLQAIYEQDFAGFSYGFRPQRGQHHALDALWVGITQRKVSWILDADIRSFFDTISHEWLMKFVEHRIADLRILRLIQKWLRAGVSEDGQLSRTTVGTPQGAVISPLLANIYLHYALDVWVKWWRKQHATSETIIVRYADDFVLGFQRQDEAERFAKDLRERLGKFGLELHQDKTRLIEFGRFAQANREKRGEGPPETFAFLGFTHICARRRSDGGFTVLRHTVAKRLQATATAIGQELKRRRAMPLADQGRWLRSVVRGYLNYHAVPGNSGAIARFRDLVVDSWRRALRRRSEKARCLTWTRMRNIAKRWLPPARILHPYPNQRLIVRT